MQTHDAVPRPVDIDVLANALRWTIGRAPRADQDADRRLLREVAVRLGPAEADDEGATTLSPTDLDARLDAALATMALDGRVADHCAPRHRGWMTDLALVYLVPPEDLPERLRTAIGPTALPFLRDGATNRARAAATVLGIDGETVRIRREPLLLEAMASALVERTSAADTGVPLSSPAAPPAASPRLGPRTVRWLVGSAVGLVALTVAVTLLVSAAVAPEHRAEPDTAPSTSTTPVDPGPPSVDVAPAAVLAPGTVTLGVAGGRLLGLADGAATDLGLGDVVAADAQRKDDRVHVAALRTDGTVVYAALGPAGVRWRELGGDVTDVTDVAVGVDSAGQAVVVAVRRDEGNLVRRRVDLDGTPLEDWERLPATGVADVDVVTNADGRIEVVGSFTSGAAFNVWQNRPPTGWTSNIDRRGGEGAQTVQGVTNLDGRLELFAARADGSIWNTWQDATGRAWTGEWDPRYLVDVTDWRVAVGADGLLVAVAVSGGEVVLRRQVEVSPADRPTTVQWPPSDVIERLDVLAGAAPATASVTRVDGRALVVVSGGGRTVGVPVDAAGIGRPVVLAPVQIDRVVALDG